jgi:phosphoserine aminotransferase
MTSDKKINFGAGPATLPEQVLQEAAAAILDYRYTGLSILEIAHRGPEFNEILEEAKTLVLNLCKLSADDYEVLWLQGGGRLQFAMIPMNFLPESGTAAYIDSGYWAADAMEHAKLWGNVAVLASSREKNYTEIPRPDENISGEYAYLHVTTNNTICGTQGLAQFECQVPLIADMSSDIFSEERDYSRFDLFYAVAQKNLGIAGATLVVLKKKMLRQTVRELNPYLSYQAHVSAKSVLNTAPIFAVYTALLMLRYIKGREIKNIETENKEKASLLYAALEASKYFYPHAESKSRSTMNIVFHAYDPALEQAFVRYCEDKNIIGIEGHRKLGGLRVSLYNVISRSQVMRLIQALQEFEQNLKQA